MNIRNLALALCLGVPGFALADFQNGSFETPVVTPGDQEFVSGTELTGWNISGGSGADIITNQFVGDAVTWNPTPDGNQFLYLNSDVSGGVVLSQSVSLAAGSNTLSFLQADFGTQFGTPGGEVTVAVYDPTDTLVTSQLFMTPNFSPFISQSLAFTAASAGSYTFDFTSVEDHAGLLDGVTVAPTPEPCSMIALGLGIAALGRRRMAKRGI